MLLRSSPGSCPVRDCSGRQHGTTVKHAPRTLRHIAINGGTINRRVDDTRRFANLNDNAAIRNSVAGVAPSTLAVPGETTRALT